MKRLYTSLCFFSYERKQFEQYLNELVEKGYHLKFKKSKIYIEENQQPIHYRVALTSNELKEDERLKMIDFFEECGYQYVGQHTVFSIFQSSDNLPIYTDSFIENEEVLATVKKEMSEDYLPLFLIVAFFVMFPRILNFDKFLSNDYFLSTIFMFLFLIVYFASYLYFYKTYCNETKLYSYKVCLFRGFILRYLALLMIVDVGFLFGTQSILLLSGVTLLFLIIGYFLYVRSYQKQSLFHFDSLFKLIFVIGLIGIIWPENRQMILPKVPTSLKDYQEIHIEKTIFLDYTVLKKDNDIFETVHTKYKSTSKYVFDKLIDDDAILSTQMIDGYQVHKSQDYVYIMKNQDMIKTNTVYNIDEFVEKLNW